MLMPPTTPARAVGVLLVDDDTELGELVREYLAREGFSLEVEGDGTRAVERALSGEYDLIVLDVMLPGVSGFDILRHLRAASRVPVLMLTARGDDVDRIVGLELGADDYLSKPFNPRELVHASEPSCADRSTTQPATTPSPPTSGSASTTSRSTYAATWCGGRAPRWSSRRSSSACSRSCCARPGRSCDATSWRAARSAAASCHSIGVSTST
jgi:CheY-like chemotaxis protein